MCTYMPACMYMHIYVVFLLVYSISLTILGMLFVFPATHKMWPHRQKSCTPGLSLEVILFCSQRSYSALAVQVYSRSADRLNFKRNAIRAMCKVALYRYLHLLAVTVV